MYWIKYVEYGVVMEQYEFVWNAKVKSTAWVSILKIIEWIILSVKCAIHNGFFMLLKKKKVRMVFSSHSQNRWDVNWVLSEWMKISYNVQSGRLGFYLNRENKKYIFFPLGEMLMIISATTYDYFCSFVKCLSPSFYLADQSLKGIHIYTTAIEAMLLINYHKHWLSISPYGIYS